MDVYLVGGAVRDALLSIPVSDRDWVVVGGSVQQMLDLGCQQVGKDFPVFLHPVSREEYALARTERKQGSGYHGFEVTADATVTLEEDLLRRDLTINAMAVAENGDLIDPYGGKRDLDARILRHVSPAFKEDPLRVLRVARFRAQLADQDFTIAPDTQALMQQMAQSGELHALVPERVWQEISKALMTPKPSLFFKTLHEVGALAVLLPELDVLFNVPQSPQHHPEGDAGTHSLMVLDAAAYLRDDLAIRFAALVHDLGKGLTPEDYWPSHPQHEIAGVPLVNAVCQRYRVPKTIQRLAVRVTEWHGQIHAGGPTMPLADQLAVLKGCDAFRQPDEFDAILTVCEADSRGRQGFEDTDYSQKAYWRGALLAVQGVDARSLVSAGLQGEAMAQAIEQLRLACLDNFCTRWLDEQDS
ncbi:multifunctional CCA addition/repair protein [Thiomicrospira sp. ALE5]|uniref:multifunctional CCA addition/repair protein n=1 Tax=Thiomicrospira sp. ALE5 TaxID=748650 RepID=UPI0008E5CFAD|nr:multifunctional CCA addition/repair protein [Thiomicrospira sp. ALE5]SFR64198.1 tRNA nucleotidyltransferase (CCA-adding enzyme) [Thiomicrospira sp. ALE5]